MTGSERSLSISCGDDARHKRKKKRKKQSLFLKFRINLEKSFLYFVMEKFVAINMDNYCLNVSGQPTEQCNYRVSIFYSSLSLAFTRQFLLLNYTVIKVKS